jgi:hypothetical protein
MEAAARRQATLLGHLRLSDESPSVERVPCAAPVRLCDGQQCGLIDH